MAGWALLFSPLLLVTSCETTPTEGLVKPMGAPGSTILKPDAEDRLQVVGIPVILPEYVPTGFHFSDLSTYTTKARKHYKVTYSGIGMDSSVSIQGTTSPTEQPASFNSTGKSIFVGALGQNIMLPAFRDGATGDFDSNKFTLRVGGSSAPVYYWLSGKNMEVSEMERVANSLRVVPQAAKAIELPRATSSPVMAPPAITPEPSMDEPPVIVKPQSRPQPDIIMAPPPLVPE